MSHDVVSSSDRKSNAHDEINEYIKRLSRKGFPISPRPRYESPKGTPMKERPCTSLIKYIYFQTIEETRSQVLENLVMKLEFSATDLTEHAAGHLGSISVNNGPFFDLDPDMIKNRFVLIPIPKNDIANDLTISVDISKTGVTSAAAAPWRLVSVVIMPAESKQPHHSRRCRPSTL